MTKRVAGLILLVAMISAGAAAARTLVEVRVSELRVLLSFDRFGGGSPKIRVDYETVTADGTRISETFDGLSVQDRAQLKGCYDLVSDKVHDALAVPSDTPTPTPGATP